MKCRKCGKFFEIYSILPDGAVKTTLCCGEYAIIRFYHKSLVSNYVETGSYFG